MKPENLISKFKLLNNIETRFTTIYLVKLIYGTTNKITKEQEVFDWEINLI